MAKNKFRLYRKGCLARIFCVCFVCTVAVIPASATTISITSSTTSGAVTPVSESKWYMRPSILAASGAVITWDWDMKVEGIPGVKSTFSEPKFPGGSGTAFTGTGPVPALFGTRGSVASVTGSGFSSTWGPGGGWVNWTVNAGTVTGTGKPLPTPFYYSTLQGTDPYCWTSEDFTDANITDLTYDHYFNIGIDAGSISLDSTDTGGITFDAFYQSALDDWKLLDIAFTTDVVSISSNGPNGLSFYLLPGIDSEPTIEPSDLVTLLDIEQLLVDDFLPDGVLDNPLYLGLYLPDIPVPTTDMGDGYVCKTGGSSMATAAGEVPEPATIALLGLGGLALVRRRRK